MIREGKIEAVSQLTTIAKREYGRYFLVYATKYCYFATPTNVKNKYPIFDNLKSYVYLEYCDRFSSKCIVDVFNGLYDNELDRDGFSDWYDKYKDNLLVIEDELNAERINSIKKMNEYFWLGMNIFLDEPNKSIKEILK